VQKGSDEGLTETSAFEVLYYGQSAVSTKLMNHHFSRGYCGYLLTHSLTHPSRAERHIRPLLGFHLNGLFIFPSEVSVNGVV